MAAAGVTLLERIESLLAMGFAEPVIRLWTHVSLLARLRRRFALGRYDLVILVDYPGFNLRVAEAAAATGIPAFYYIAPQAWAWAPARAERLRRSVRSVAVILPFEEPFFTARGVPARFVGHPLLDGIYPSRADARRQLGLKAERPVLALLPGSRPLEVRRLWPPLREAARRLRVLRPDLAVVVPAVSGCAYPDARDIRLCWEPGAAPLAAADVAVCKAGTGALEAALADVPSVVVYRTDPMSYALARRVARVRSVGLVNLLAGGDAVPELLQEHARPAAILAALLPLMDRDGAAAQSQQQAYRRVREQLGGPGAADRTAAMALELVA
jgi:lipid-A-disaccharide synthase